MADQMDIQLSIQVRALSKLHERKYDKTIEVAKSRVIHLKLVRPLRR